MANNNEVLVSNARNALEQLKQETAAELGIANYAQQYKGDLPSRVHGSLGGYMAKKWWRWLSNSLVALVS